MHGQAVVLKKRPATLESLVFSTMEDKVGLMNVIVGGHPSLWYATPLRSNTARSLVV